MAEDQPSNELAPREPTVEDLRNLGRELNRRGAKYAVLGGFVTRKLVLLLFACAIGGGGAMAQTGACPWRISEDGIVRNPPDLSSTNGVLKAALTIRSDKMHEQNLRECYIYEASFGAVEAPTLRVNPGDQLELALTNRLSYVPPPPANAMPAPQAHGMTDSPPSAGSRNACEGGAMLPTSTNLHFHGLSIPPACHQDEVLSTTIENTDPAFTYKFQMPRNQSPGMYWYHPHLHGFSTLQVNGGAAGVLIVGGIEKVKPEVAGLPERVLIIRQEFKDANSWLPGPNNLTLNFQPALYPRRRSPVIPMKPGTREFWRVANAASQAFLSLQVVFGDAPQPVTVVARDGVPLHRNLDRRTIELPPGGRAEFIVTAPSTGQAARLQQAGFDTGPIGPLNPPRELAKMVATEAAEVPPSLSSQTSGAAKPASAGNEEAGRKYVAPIASRITARRKLYFSEAAAGTNGPTEFMLTVEGQTPRVFDHSSPPAIITNVGAVEDWTISNHAGEVHAFHIHQVHFLLLEINGRKLRNPEWRDTVTVPAWDGVGPYPSVKLRLDFRDRQIAGTFVFHCHILDHEDAGMMGKIQVNVAP